MNEKNWRNKICFTPPKKFWGLPRTVGTAGTNRDYEPGWCLLRCVVRVSPVLILLLRVSAPTHIFAESGLVAAARVALPAPSRHQLPASEVIGDPVTVFSVEAGPASARHWSGAPPWREDSVMQWPGPEQLSAGPRTPPLVSSEGQGSSSRVGYIGSCPRRGSGLGAAVIREHSDCDETGTEAWWWPWW